MRKIACVDYSDKNCVLTIVFMDGEHECYLNVSRAEAWLILRKINQPVMQVAC